MIKKILKTRIDLIALLLICVLFNYKFFILGQVPFPGDLLVNTYSPWFDYYHFPVQNPLISDIFSQFYLWKYLSIDSFKMGQWPLWNPYSFLGTPLLATFHSAVLYPLNILLFLPKSLGWGLYIFSQSLVAALSMYTLLSLWCKSKVARITGAIIFSFSGLMTTWTEFGTGGHAMAWIPLDIFLIEKYLNTQKLRYALLITLSLLMTSLAGHAQILTYTLIILTFYCLTHLVRKDFKKTFKNLVVILCFAVLTFFLAAPQLLPTAELYSKSIRSLENYTIENNYGLLPLKEAVKMFNADFFGSPVTRNYWGFLNYSETSSFLGTLTLVLIIFAVLFLKRTRVSIFFLSLFVVSLILSFKNPLSEIIYQSNIPLLTSSYATRALFMTTLAASILSGLALNQIKFDKKLFIAVFASLALISLVILLTYNFNRHNPSADLMTSLRNSILPLAIITGFTFFCCSLFFIPKRFAEHRAKILIFCFLILTVFDLGRYFVKFNPFVDGKYVFPDTPFTQYLQSIDKPFRMGRERAEILPPNTWIAYGLQNIDGYDPLYLTSYAKFYSFLNGQDITKAHGSRYAELSNYNMPFLNAANIKYFIAVGRDDHAYVPGKNINHNLYLPGLERVFQDKSAVIIKNTNALEKAYFAKNVLIHSESETEKLLSQKDFDPTTTVVVNHNSNLNQVSGAGSIKIVSYTPNQININTTSDTDQLLVVADQFEEGWKSYVDQKPTETLKANLVFRAIKVPAGNHTIRMIYYPDSFDKGLKLMILGLFSYALIIVYSYKKKIM